MQNIQCSSEIESGGTSNGVELHVEVECDCSILVHLKQVECRLSLMLGISAHVLRLCFYKEGCIELIFLIPSFVQETIFPLSSEQEKAFMEQGVIHLSCEGYHWDIQVHYSLY